MATIQRDRFASLQASFDGGPVLQAFSDPIALLRRGVWRWIPPTILLAWLLVALYHALSHDDAESHPRRFTLFFLLQARLLLLEPG